MGKKKQPSRLLLITATGEEIIAENRRKQGWWIAGSKRVMLIPVPTKQASILRDVLQSGCRSLVPDMQGNFQVRGSSVRFTRSMPSTGNVLAMVRNGSSIVAGVTAPVIETRVCG